MQDVAISVTVIALAAFYICRAIEKAGKERVVQLNRLIDVMQGMRNDIATMRSMTGNIETKLGSLRDAAWHGKDPGDWGDL